MALIRRLYQGEDDYWRIRAFLREVLLRNGLRELSWHVAEFDYWRWHLVANLGGWNLADVVFLWETADGRLAAVLNPIMNGEAILHIHPDFRTPELEDEMLAVADTARYSAKRYGKDCIVVDGVSARESGARDEDLPSEARRQEFGEGIRDDEELVELDLGLLREDSHPRTPSA